MSTTTPSRARRRLACDDVVPGCTRTFVGDTITDILEQVVEHAREAHGITSVPPPVAAKVVAAIR